MRSYLLNSLAALSFAATSVVSVPKAGAATFDFNFNFAVDNVTGTIELPDGDGVNLAATSVAITTAPSPSISSPLNLLKPPFIISPSSFTNTFDVSDGKIVSSHLVIRSRTATGATLSLTWGFFAFGTSLTGGGYNFAFPLETVATATRVVTTDLSFEPQGLSSVPLPLPGVLMGGAMLAAFGCAKARRRRRSA